jgi:hypothetical protein
MDLPRKLGIGIVMLVPTFVGCGALYAIFHSLIPAIIWIPVMGVVYAAIITGKFKSLFSTKAGSMSSSRHSYTTLPGPSGCPGK